MKKKKLFLLLLLAIFALEIVLRIQQKAGPVLDLGFNKLNLDTVSDILNHKNVGEMIDFYKGKKIKKFYDNNGLRIYQLMPYYSNDTPTFKILFMGDSFMEGYDEGHTLPYHTWQYLQQKQARNIPISYFNAGCNSYSPAVFIPQAKILLPLIKPDLVVIDIDETDLGDDFIRYRDLIVRDKAGKIIAVKHTPINQLFLSGLLRINKQPLYLMRLISKIYHIHIYFPLKYRQYHKKYPYHVLSFSRDKNGSYEKYAREILFFRDNLAELVETLIYLMNDKKRILFIYHPHLQHLKPDKYGFFWNNFVSETLKKVCEKYQVNFYNAAEDLKNNFKGQPEKYYIRYDMHFNYDGLKRYADLVAERIYLIISLLLRDKEEEAGTD